MRYYIFLIVFLVMAGICGGFKSMLSATPAECASETDFAVYAIKSTVGQKILLRIDFAADKSIENISFSLPEIPSDGKYKYALVAKEGNTISLEFFFRDGSLRNLKIDTDYHPLEEDRGKSTVLTVLDELDQEIMFTFTWNADGSIENVNVRLKVVGAFPAGLPAPQM